MQVYNFLFFLFAEVLCSTHLKSLGLTPVIQGGKQESLKNFTGSRVFPVSQRMISQCKDKTGYRLHSVAAPSLQHKLIPGH